MAYIVCRRVRGKEYFFRVEGYRENGKVKQRVLEYYGRNDPRKNPDARPIIKSQEPDGSYNFGDVSLVYHAAQKIGFMECVENYASKRQGIPLNQELFLTVAQRLLDNRPSSAGLSAWAESTHLPELLNFNAKNITDDTQAYMMDKLYNEEKNVDHLYRISIDLYQNALRLFGKEDDTYFYDITSTYFKGKHCPIATFGHNKDGKLDKLQINIAMIMNGAYGLPVVSKVFEGNINDASTVHEMVYYPKVIMRKKKCLLIMGRGFESENNVRLIDSTKYDYIVGLRSTHKFVRKLKSETDFSKGDWETINNDYNEIKLHKTIKNIFGKRRIVILYYSQKVAEEQRGRRNLAIENAVERLKAQGIGLTLKSAEKIVGGLKRYFVIEQEGGEIRWRLNQIQINKAERDDGKFCLMTNKDIKPKDAFSLYFSKDKIEKRFGDMKQSGNMRPVYKKLTDHVIADVFISHVALLLMRVVEHLARQKKIDKTWDGLSSESANIRLIKYKLPNGKSKFQIVSNNEFQKSVVSKFDLYRYVPVYTTSLK